MNIAGCLPPMWDHKPDPDGDITLILRNPNAPFAVEVYEVPSPWELDCGWGVLGIKGPSVDAVPKPSAGPKPASPPQKEVRFRLSSRHLSLASPYFKAMLDGDWKESNDRVASAKDWDEEALVVLMCIIHGRTRFVPRTISLDLLAKIAVLVDYYKCHETVEFVVETWIGKLEQPTEMSRDLILWLLISWVFQRAEIFKSVTKIALHQSKDRLMLSNLPMPRKIGDMIFRLRASIIREILSSLQVAEQELIQEKAGCSSACSTMLLGALCRGMSIAGLPYRDTSTLDGLSFDGMRARDLHQGKGQN
ncbi:hypothetical protein RB595_008586 [Gaeumannomyces hyphopodioides]